MQSQGCGFDPRIGLFLYTYPRHQERISFLHLHALPFTSFYFFIFFIFIQKVSLLCVYEWRYSSSRELFRCSGNRVRD
ncbi:hypothetical protein CI102_9843 [Trichoderma harzianum]|nr:hypothetical protein CI102_9843 [Trichoderma harzianum]